MMKASCRCFVISVVTLTAVALWMSVPVNAIAKGKAGKAKPAAKDTEADKASEADATASTDTDADEIFTEDELKTDTAASKTESETKAEEEPTEKEPELASESTEAEEDKTVDDTVESTAADNKGEEVEDVGDVEVTASSDQKKGFFPTEFDGPDALKRDRGINILTARVTRPMALTLVIDHRPYMKLAADEAEDVFFNYLGLDGGNLKVGLGLRFGIIEGLDVGLYRLNDGGTVPWDTYELDARYAFLKQEKFFVDASVRAGISWFSIKNADDAVGGYGEIFVDRIFFDMLLVGVGFQFHSSSTNDVKKNEEDGDDPYSGAILGVIEWRMIKQLAFVAEVAASVVGYGADYGNSKRPSIPASSLGLKVLTRRHTFAFMISNTQFINADGIVANSWRDFGDVIFGFQIMREFNFR